MSQQQRWTDPTGPLDRLAAELRLDAGALQLNEGPEALHLVEEKYDVPARLALPADAAEREKRLAALDAALRGARDKYGPALKLQFKVGTRSLLKLDDYERAKLDDFFSEFGGDVVVLDLKVDKRELADYWGLADASADVKLFLYPDALVRALSQPLTDTEKGRAIFGDARGQKKVLVLVPAHKIELDGKYLAVLGGEALTRWKVYAASSSPDPAELKFIHKEAGDKLRWVQFDIDHITPHHLYVSWKDTPQGEKNMPPGDDKVAAALYGQLFACSLLYMAGHTSLDGRARGGAAAVAGAPLWVSTFSAEKYLTKFDIGDTVKLAGTLREVSPEKPWEVALAVAKLATWCYDVVRQRGVSERLSVMQNVVASSMQGNSPAVNCRELASQAASLYATADVRLESFTQKELDKYLTQVKELEDSVAETTKGYNEQVQSLTKTLTDNMLAAVAVVVGSFIAAVFKSPFEAKVFLFGTWIYVAYLVIFPIGVGLVSTWQRFADLRDSFTRRQREFEKRLTKAEVDRVVGQTMTDRESWFHWWYGATIVLYALVLGSVVTAIFIVPSRIKSWDDSFELREVTYGGPAASDTVPLVVRGEQFNDKKEIVVSVGGARFTNTDGQTLKVHGTTVLTLAPRQEDLAAIADKDKRVLTVKQGQAGPEEIKLPEGTPPIPRPAFTSWKRAPARAAPLEADGSNFGSISAVTFGGAAWAFKPSTDGKRLELSVPITLKQPLEGLVLDITLKNGEKMQAPVKLAAAKPT